MQERNIHPEVKDLLLSGEEFQYAHLVKFERPSRAGGTDPQRYTYITDASREVTFDDASKDSSGNFNGPKVYVANKVLKVSAVSEDVVAKASSYSLVLDGNGLGAYAKSSNASIEQVDEITWDIRVPGVDLVEAGFRENDKIALSGSVEATVNIYRFRAADKIRVRRIDDDLVVSPRLNLELALASEEVVSILLDKNDDNYASFVNREVFIYKAYFQEGRLVGEPFLLFKGIISGVGFDDDDTALTVTWNLTSHWGDFSQVKGRITSDDFHRALDQNGVPQPRSALKVSYAYDKGFSHSETSVNLLAKYSVQVEKQDVKVKKGFLGIGTKVKVRKYLATEERSTELDFQLQSKSIPVIYGVRNTLGTPIFADTLNNDSSTVYVVYALSEGEIAGLYDAIIDGNSLICSNKADFDARSTQTDEDTVNLICRGRADRGDVLGGTVSTAPNTKVPFYDFYYSNRTEVVRAGLLRYDLNQIQNYQPYVEPAVTTVNNSGAGVVDGESIALTSPQNIVIDFFSGKPGQKAASSLVSIAKSNGFKIQNDYWNGKDTADYWGPNHRLMDTAYVVVKYKVEEGETTIPSLEFIVRGKLIDCFNYDKSYSHYPKAVGESSEDFQLGDFVTLQRDDGSVLLNSVQIIDKWTFSNKDKTLNTRFRFSIDPPLGYVNGVPTLTKFRMVKDSKTWTMFTYNHKEAEGSNSIEWLTPITSVSNSNGFVQFNFAPNPALTIGGDPAEDSSVFSVVEADGSPVTDPYFESAVLVGSITSSTLTTNYSWQLAGSNASSLVGKYLVRRNVITLPTTASTADGFYNNYDITLTRIDPVRGTKTSQTKRVISYNGASRVATIDELWDYGLHPKNGDEISLTPAYADSRVSINPAMQLMNYICSTTYGRGLDPHEDLNLSTWLESARTCDQQSNVTVQLASDSSVTEGDVYRYPAEGRLLWQGSVVGSEGGFVEFTNVLGKLTNKWNSWKSYKLGELVYSDNSLYRVVTAGVKANKPIHVSGTVEGLERVTSLQLSRTGSTPAVLSLVTDGNPVRAMKDGTIIPGYSLYDCDGVDYWRYLGWDEFSQRYVTKHQTNIGIDTSLPLFDNVNSFLEHFGGVLRYTNGKYDLEVEEPVGLIERTEEEVYNVTSDHIIGKIRITDEGVRSSFNALTAAYADPANKFESRNISFFNSVYQKIDKGVQKKGNLTVPGITNYYNTRLLADKYLNKSRYGLTISFNMAPRGALMLAGRVFQLQNERYGWLDKKFRITTLTHQVDSSVDIVAEEYDDSFYGLSNISKQAASGLASNLGAVTPIGSPTNLTATSQDAGTETTSAVEVRWENNPQANTRNMSTELYSSYSPYLYVKAVSISGNTITTSEPHGLRVGELITSSSTSNGLVANRAYYIKEITSDNSFTVSDSKDGPIKGLSDGTSLEVYMLTANLIATISIPTNTYVDVFGGIDSRVVKYYWVRHKVIQAQ